MDLNFPALLMVILTGIFRAGEIALGENNARAMMAKGGREFASWQRAPIFIAYTIWLIALAFMVPKNQPIEWLFIFIFALLQALRWWAIAHLKGYWTTRIVVVPLEWKVITGPYKYLSHPIYVVLVGEVLALSMAFGQWALGCLFAGITLLWVFFRMRSENRALSMML